MDRDLAEMYGIETKVLKQAVKRKESYKFWGVIPRTISQYP
jgi:hypothetical protein